MRTFLVLLFIAICLAAIQCANPLNGARIGDLRWPDRAFLIAAVFVLIVATFRGLAGDSATRSLALFLWGLACVTFSILTFGGGEIALALGVALLILSITEFIRASREDDERSPLPTDVFDAPGQ